jgi:hypothetical protein
LIGKVTKFLGLLIIAASAASAQIQTSNLAQAGTNDFSLITSVPSLAQLKDVGSPSSHPLTCVTGTTCIGIAGLAPTEKQNVIQPSGTTREANTLNGVVNASTFPGADIGTQLNNAIAAVSEICGTVMLPPGSYKLTEQVLKPRCVWIEGNNAQINSTIDDPNIPAIVTGSVEAETHPYAIGGIRNLRLVGPGFKMGTVGIYLGGPVGSSVAPVGNEDYLDDFENVAVRGFGSGYQKGSNVYQDAWFGGSSTANEYGFSDVGLFGSENMNFYGWEDLNNNTYGFYSLNTASSEYHFIGCSFDYNGTARNGIYKGGAFYYANGTIRIVSGHLEQFGGRFFSGPSTATVGFNWDLHISNGTQFVVGSTGTDVLVNVVGFDGGVYIDPGVQIVHIGPIGHFVNWTAVGVNSVLMVGPYWDPTAKSGITFPPFTQSAGRITYVEVPHYSQYSPDYQVHSHEVIQNLTAGTTTDTGFVGSTRNSNGSLPATSGIFPTEGNFLGWNADGMGGADFYNVFASKTGTAFHWRTFDGSGWAQPMALSRAGDLTVHSVLPANGFTGTKTAGSCVFTIANGIITNVTGC